MSSSQTSYQAWQSRVDHLYVCISYMTYTVWLSMSWAKYWLHHWENSYFMLSLLLNHGLYVGTHSACTSWVIFAKFVTVRHTMVMFRLIWDLLILRLRIKLYLYYTLVWKKISNRLYFLFLMTLHIYTHHVLYSHWDHPAKSLPQQLEVTSTLSTSSFTSSSLQGFITYATANIMSTTFFVLFYGVGGASLHRQHLTINMCTHYLCWHLFMSHAASPLILT